MNRVIGIAFILLLVTSDIQLNAQTKLGEITWYDWDEGYIKAKESKKILLVDVISFKCPFCVKMDNETYKDQEIIGIVNKDFICVRVNPKIENARYKVDNNVYDGKQLISFLTRNSTYAEDPKMAFPTTVFVLPYNQEVFVEPGYQEAKVFKYMLFNCVKYKERIEKKMKK